MNSEYHLNVVVGDAILGLCYDSDNERLILVPVRHIQPNERMVFASKQTLEDWLNMSDYLYAKTVAVRVPKPEEF